MKPTVTCLFPRSFMSRMATVLAPLFLALAPCDATSGLPNPLRELARLPPVNFEAGFFINSTLGLCLGKEPLDLSKLDPPRARLDRLESEIGPGSATPEQWFDRARLRNEAGDSDGAEAALDRAIEGFQERLSGDPDHAWTRSQLGKALALAGRNEASESLLRAAAAAPSADWRCWQALGDHLHADILNTLASGARRSESRQSDTVITTVSADLLTSEQRSRMHRRLIEAHDCYDRAVAKAPDNPDAYTARLLFRWAAAQIIEPALYAEKRPDSPPAFWRSLRGALDDLHQVADLSPQDPYALGASAVFEAMALDVSSPPQLFTPGVWTGLSEAGQARVRERMRKLEALTESPHRTVAAGAWSALGAVQLLVLHDLTNAEESFRRATQLNPLPENAWDALRLIMGTSHRWEDLFAVNEARLRVKQTGRDHFMLAKAHEKLGRLKQAEQEAEKAAHAQPSFLHRLGLTALRLRNAPDEMALEPVGRALVELGPQLGTVSREEFFHFHFLTAICLALQGEWEHAREIAGRLLEANPEDRDYKQLRDLLHR